MSKILYNLVKVEADNKWDEFVHKSYNGTIFITSLYLNSINVNYELYFCYKKEELRAAVAVIVSKDNKSLVLDDLVIYNGIIYNNPTNKQNQAQQYSEQFRIQQFIAEELAKKYTKIQMSLHPSIVDVRAILWVNYGTDLPKYKTNIRYTSYIDISDFKNKKALDDISVYNESSVSRRQQIRYAIKKGYKTKITTDVDRLIEFYEKTMRRQGESVLVEKIQNIKKLSNQLIQNKVAKIYASYDELDEIGSMALFAWDNKRAYYIFGANDPLKRNGHSGTNVLWEAFYDLSNMKGIKEVDLEGVNSPQRGWFKLSFGGEIIPYYEISLGE